MKLKKLVVLVLVTTMIFSLSACSKKQENVDQKQTNKVEQNEDIEKKINDLVEKENEILEKHKDLWEKAFEKANKDDVETSKEMAYDEFLESLVEKIKADLKDEEVKSLKEDIEEIKTIEKDLAPLKGKMEKNMENKIKENLENKFPEFKAKDLDGNEVTSDTFKDHSITLVNFWFNGCAPCVGELQELQKLNDSIKEKGGQVIGINTECMDNNENSIKEAKKIAKDQGITYPNLILDSESPAGKFALKIMAFPTSILVDRNANIIGDPIVAGVDRKDVLEEVQSRIDQIIKNDKNK